MREEDPRDVGEKQQQAFVFYSPVLGDSCVSLGAFATVVRDPRRLNIWGAVVSCYMRRHHVSKSNDAGCSSACSPGIWDFFNNEPHFHKLCTH